MRLKERQDWTLIGQAAPRTDIPAKSNGTARFGMDVRLPDMLYASVVQSPQLGGSVAFLDATEALAMPGVLRLVRLDAEAGGSAGSSSEVAVRVLRPG